MNKEGEIGALVGTCVFDLKAPACAISITTEFSEGFLPGVSVPLSVRSPNPTVSLVKSALAWPCKLEILSGSWSTSIEIAANRFPRATSTLFLSKLKVCRVYMKIYKKKEP